MLNALLRLSVLFSASGLMVTGQGRLTSLLTLPIDRTVDQVRLAPRIISQLCFLMELRWTVTGALLDNILSRRHYLSVGYD